MLGVPFPRYPWWSLFFCSRERTRVRKVSSGARLPARNPDSRAISQPCDLGCFSLPRLGLLCEVRLIIGSTLEGK